FFFPIVKRLAVDLVNGRLGNFHFAGLPCKKEIDVVSLSVRPVHIHTGEVFAAAEILQSIIVHFYQCEDQVLTLVRHMELAVTALSAFALDVLLDTRGNISRADLFCLRALFRMFRALLGMFRGFLRMLRMLLGTDRCCWCEEYRDSRRDY